ncbi:MAG: rhodanese-related sulfurtransferase [Verrucomicrobia bacterium]|nr:rhodanese-related sulfurtransferase [Verrucomicrobiota bacterium]
MSDFQIAAFYQFCDFHDFRDWRRPLQELGAQHGITGSILLAHEGMNSTIAGTDEGMKAMLDFIRSDARFATMEVKFSRHQDAPFYRFKVRLKKEIVSMGVPEIAPHQETAIRLDSQSWNELLQQQDVVVIDTRNDYETKVGMFKGALDPNTKSFREFPHFVDKQLDPAKHTRVAMYCTGGIRCEKASAYLLRKGFREVYQLHGGILKYLEDTQPEERLWDGECFVFDQRVAVDGSLSAGEHVLCYACREPLTKEDLTHPDYEENVSCRHCRSRQTEAQRSALRERQKQIDLAKKRGERHIGVSAEELKAKRQAAKVKKKAAADA